MIRLLADENFNGDILRGLQRRLPAIDVPRVQNLALRGADEVLQRWVENDEAPEQIAATSAPGVTPVRTRPWCLYPKKLKYVSGDVNTGNFTCE